MKLSVLDNTLARDGQLSSEEMEDLAWLANANPYGDEQRAMAKMLLWCLNAAQGGHEANDEYQKLRKRLAGDKDGTAAVRLCHAEFLKRAGDLRSSERDLTYVLGHAQDQGYGLLELHALTVLADVRRLQGFQCDWQGIAERFRAAGCRIGETQAVLVGLAAEERVPAAWLRRATAYAGGKKEVRPVTAALERIDEVRRRKEPLQFVFPGIATLY